MSDTRKRHYSSSSDSDGEDYLQWKISKLQKCLKLKKKNRRRSPSSSFSGKHRSRRQSISSSHHVSSRRRRVLPLDSPPTPSRDLDADDDIDSDNVPLSALARGAIADSDVGGSVIEEMPAPAPEENDSLASSLDKDVLALLGDVEPLQEVVGPKIHADLVSRWSVVLGKGLSDDALNVLIKKYPPTENCPLLRSSRLNCEIISAINAQVMRRDATLVGLQTQVGSALSALGQLLSGLISEGGGGGRNRSNIGLASDTSRLLLDLHYKYSVLRRDLLVLNLRKDLKDTLTAVSADGWLFGSDLGDRIKANKDIKKTAMDLKPSSSLKKPFPIPKDISSLNLRRPSQLPRGASRGGRHSSGSSQKQRQKQPPRSSFLQDRLPRSNVRPKDNRRKY